jgi:hypothetical protein
MGTSDGAVDSHCSRDWADRQARLGSWAIVEDDWIVAASSGRDCSSNPRSVSLRFTSKLLVGDNPLLTSSLQERGPDEHAQIKMKSRRCSGDNQFPEISPLLTPDSGARGVKLA